MSLNVKFSSTSTITVVYAKLFLIIVVLSESYAINKLCSNPESIRPWHGITFWILFINAFIFTTMAGVGIFGKNKTKSESLLERDMEVKI